MNERCTNTQGGHGFDSRQLHLKPIKEKQSFLWRHPIHETARSIAEIKKIYNAIDLDAYPRKDGDENQLNLN